MTPPCPAAPPTAGSSCTGTPSSCYYENCAAGGRTAATCTGGTWRIETAPCAPTPCQGGMTCPAGKFCLQIVSGALLIECRTNSCGTGPVNCGCLPCQGNCYVQATVQAGIHVTCNNCPGPLPCP